MLELADFWQVSREAAYWPKKGGATSCQGGHKERWSLTKQREKGDFYLTAGSQLATNIFKAESYGEDMLMHNEQ